MAPITSKIREKYTAFMRPGRILLTGHSHQAWPDVAEGALNEAFHDAAGHVDDKWQIAMAKADQVRACVGEYLETPGDEITLAQNTHELLTRFLSALDWRRRRIVTTAGEFHSMKRQLNRLEEEGVDVVWVEPFPLSTLGARLADALNESTAALMVSTVLYQYAAPIPNLEEVIDRALEVGAQVFLDAYHAFQVMPNELDVTKPVFISGGGYKYAQWGEGVCWLRVPSSCTLRPVYTGWFSDFSGLDGPQPDRVHYGSRPADRFAGSTYDPISHYRAVAVIDFFKAEGMTIEALRTCSLKQTQRIIDGLDGLEVLTPDSEQRGGFVSVRVPAADVVVSALRREGIYTDSRGDILRLGPAPYVTDEEIDHGVARLRHWALDVAN